MTILSRLRDDRRGAQAVEIALGIVLIALVAGLGMATLGNQLGLSFKDMSDSVPGPAANPAPNTNNLP